LFVCGDADKLGGNNVNTVEFGEALSELMSGDAFHGSKEERWIVGYKKLLSHAFNLCESVLRVPGLWKKCEGFGNHEVA
jgi:hypothetical protein